jgi:hypothetical protein
VERGTKPLLASREVSTTRPCTNRSIWSRLTQPSPSCGQPPPRRTGVLQHRYADPTGPPDRLREQQHARPATLKVPGWSSVTERCRTSNASSRCELQPWIATEHGGYHRQGEVPGEVVSARRPTNGRSAARWPRRPAGAGEIRGRTLDVEDVASEAAARYLTRFGVFGEHGRVAERGAVRRRRRAHDHLAYGRRLLASGEQLHRADGVLFLHRRPAAGLPVR